MTDEARDFSLTALQSEVSAWAEDRWPDATVISKCRKLIEEAGELGEACAILASLGDDAETGELIAAMRHAMEEAADVQLVLLHLFKQLGVEGHHSIAAHCREVWESKKDRATR